MRALMLRAAEGPSAISFEQVPTGTPAAGQVQVRLRAASLNHRELWISRGEYPNMVLPTMLGCDGAGVIEAVGDGVGSARIGEAVILYPGLHWGDDPEYPSAAFGFLGMPGPGTLAESIILDADAALPKPPGFSFAQAACMPLAALTAWRGLTTKGGIKPSDKVLITGVGGGVAACALQIAVALGAEVYVTSGSEETIAKAVRQGATAGFNYKLDGWGKELRRVSAGITLVFDSAPNAGYRSYGRSLAIGARIVVYGSTGGASFPVSAPELFLKNLYIIGTNGGNPAEFAAVIAFFVAHGLRPNIDRTFSFQQALEALAYLEAGHGFGKVVVSMAD